MRVCSVLSRNWEAIKWFARLVGWNHRLSPTSISQMSTPCRTPVHLLPHNEGDVHRHISMQDTGNWTSSVNAIIHAVRLPHTFTEVLSVRGHYLTLRCPQRDRHHVPVRMNLIDYLEYQGASQRTAAMNLSINNAERQVHLMHLDYRHSLFSGWDHVCLHGFCKNNFLFTQEKKLGVPVPRRPHDTWYLTRTLGRPVFRP